MYCTEAVAESIIRAYSEKKISLDLELTPLQTELKVAPALVFLAGLVVDETKAKKRFTTRQQALFSKLQQIYNDSNASSMARSPFTLSPALLPSPKARLEIQARVQEFEQELTKESNAVFETLFQDENEGWWYEKEEKQGCKGEDDDGGCID